MEKEIHKVQASILKELVFNNGTNFASLNKTGLTNDHFTFHVNQLLKDTLVKKEKGKYYLTQKGKEVAGQLDTKELKITEQAKISVIVAPVRNNGKEFLIQRRTKEPMYGNYGFLTGKVRKFETSFETAKRELFEETGLRGNKWTFICVARRFRGPSKDNLILDNIFYIWRVDDPVGDLVNTKEGENMWLKETQISNLSPVFVGFEDTFIDVKAGKEKPMYEKFYKMAAI